MTHTVGARRVDGVSRWLQELKEVLQGRAGCVCRRGMLAVAAAGLFGWKSSWALWGGEPNAKGLATHSLLVWG